MSRFEIYADPHYIVDELHAEARNARRSFFMRLRAELHTGGKLVKFERLTTNKHGRCAFADVRLPGGTLYELGLRTR